MSHIELREVGLDDAPWIAGLLTRCRPADPVDPRVLRHQWATMRVSWWQWRSAVVVGDDPVGLATASHPPWALEPERMGRWNLSLLPAVTGLSSLGAAAFCVVLAAYVVFGYPIMGLADQGAKALGLR